MSRAKTDEYSFNKKKIREMFDHISNTYDFLNHFFSIGIDKYWRRKTVQLIANKPKKMLDVATGTGDLAIKLTKLNPVQIIGIDVSENMLKIAKKKIKKKGVNNCIKLKKADAENLPFRNQSFDTVTIAFGIRNIQNKVKALQEMHRVLKKQGTVIILEFSSDSLPKKIFSLYFNTIVPFIGGFISGHKKAYKYLNESINQFPSEYKFKKIIKKAGFNSIKTEYLTFSMCTIYICKKI